MTSDETPAPGAVVLDPSRLLVQGITTVDAEEIGDQLVDSRQQLLQVLRTCVGADDVKTLTAIHSDCLAVHKALTAVAVDTARVIGTEPFHRNESRSVHAARAVAALALALVEGPDRAEKHLTTFRRWIAESGLRSPSEPVLSTPSTLQTPHADTMRYLAATGNLDLLSLTWMAELDGWLSRDRGGHVRPGPSIQVLLDLGNTGRPAVLSLSLLTGLPSGLVPDPATMTLTSADEAFRDALAAAWATAGGRSSNALLWSLTDQAGPITRITNESLGVAFSVLLDEQRRLSRKVLKLVTVRRLQPRTFVVGRIDPHEPDAASSVAGYERKLAVIEVNSRVVLPADDQDQARAANAQRGDDGVELVPVRTWKQAARKSRALARRRLFALASACLLILALAGFGLYRASLSDRAAEERRAVAADLAARSSFLRSTDPLLAAKLGLAAHRIDPENSRAVEALRTVLVDNRNMVRAWQADVSRVDAIAVDESLDRVLTSGSEESTKLWKQSTGQPLGHLPTHTLLMTKASDQAIVAGMTTEGLALFDIGSEQLSQIGKIETTCAPDDDAVAMGFTHSDTKLVVVWESGAISTHDVLTRTQLSCLSWQEALTPLTFNSLPMDKVVAADVIGPAYNDRSDDEVVLVLSNNNVVSVRTGSRDARIEVPADKLTADASLVSGSGTTISLATDLGVVVWNRTDQTLLLNPAGGLAKRPRTISESNGSLLVSGSAGTVVVPLSSSGWKVPESLKTPSGGAATVAAIDDHSIMAGGPGGRVWAIADSTGELTIGRRTPVSSVRFLPDGQLLTAEVPSDGGKSIGTNSNGLAIIDPKAQLKYDGTDPQIPRWENGGSQNRFYVNDVAVSDYYVAAAGQVNRRAAVLVWSRFGDRKVPRELLFPQPDDEKSKPQEKIVGAVEFTSDGKTLLARHVRGQIGMWSTETWKSTGTIDLKSDNARFTVHSGHAFAFQADDKKSELVKIDLTTREVTRRVAVPNAVQLTANQDGDKVVTMTWDNSIQTWDGELRAVGTSWRPVSNGDPSWEIKISPNGKLLAIGQGDNVQIYDTGLRTQTVPAIDTRANIVVGLNWSFDSELLAMSTMTPTRGLKQVGPLQIWRVGGQDWTSQVCRLTDGGLSPDEWSAYGAGKLPFIDICAEVRK